MVARRYHIEGPEGIKWGLGIACFVLGKGRFHALGLRFLGQKTIDNGNGIKIGNKTVTSTIGFVPLDDGI